MLNYSTKYKPRYVKSEAVKEMEKLAFNEARRKHPSMPIHALAPRIYKDNTANALTKCIVDYITLKKGFASRLNSTGIYRQDIQKFVPNTQKRGLSDVIAVYKGKSLNIEVKMGLDRLSEHQIKVKRDIESSGGLFFIAKDFESFKIWFDNL
ncbi:MAG: hypothetical protein AB7S50_08210 [Bacteroidales bacterium]